MNKVKKIKYYKIEFELISPLMLGSGENKYTDSDVIKDFLGKPYIPASSIAGVVISKLKEKGEQEDILKEYLGYVDNKADKGKKSEHEESEIIFYDGLLVGDEYKVSVRDSVALDEYKTAKKGSKFDMEILEPGVKFYTYLEQSIDDEHPNYYVDTVVDIFANSKIMFGAKTMRGYGEIGNVCIKFKEFNLFEKEEFKNWVDFELYSFNDWDCISNEIKSENDKSITLLLKQKSGISIRRYTTEVSKENDVAPDMEQLTLHANSKDDKIPVIPGTSWAGAFRHRMEDYEVKLLGNKELTDELFGYVNGDNKKCRSIIRFSESQIKNVKAKKLSRNAIDRFYGGTVEGALFTERTYYGGETELSIGFRKSKNLNETEKNEEIFKILAATITDLHFGFLAVGGETSIGRGLFEINKINGKDIEKEISIDAGKMYEIILKEVKGGL